MVYDPVRDCDVPSPAVSRRPSLWDSSPSSGNPQPTVAPPPPAFAAERSPVPMIRPPSGPGSLRNLLNDDSGVHSRRGSDMTVASSVYDDDHGSSSGARPHLAKLLNEPAPPLVRTGSQSSAPSGYHDASSPRMSSPSVGLHPGSAHRGSVSRSPLLANTNLSSPAGSQGYPYDMQHTPMGYGGPSSRRSSMDMSRPMPPPAEPIRHADMYSTPGSHHMPLRSPSVSVSPRSQHVPLPPPRQSSTSRPGSSRPESSRSSSTAFGHTSAHENASPETLPRRLSDDAQAPPLRANGRRYTNNAPPPMVKPYAPSQPSHSSTLHRPIDVDELMRLRELAVSNNPLRRPGRRPKPSWSAPSPSTADPEVGQPGSAGPSRRNSMSTAANNGPAPVPHTQRTDYGESRGSKRQHEEIPDGRSEARPRPEYSGNAATVASHYNSRPDVGIQHREFSPIIGLKKFNNWTKSVLIGKFAWQPEYRGQPGAKVLDIGCGKGGDLNKWKQARIDLYVGMDIAETSVNQARGRWETMRGKKFGAFFVAHDCYANPISDVLPDDLQRREFYDNVSMQFCMHYAFETASKARMMMENVSRYLRRGGVFMGTIPNSALLLERLDEIPEGEPLTFGNSCYSIAFTERRHAGVYGHAYRFYLQDAVEDVPEYIVDWDNFVNLAREYGLQLIYHKTFNDVLQEEQGSRDFGPLLGSMGVVNEHGESAMDSDQWEAANLYMAFAFEKV